MLIAKVGPPLRSLQRHFVVVTFEQAHIINMSVTKLSHTKGLEPCQLLMAVDGDVIIIVYRSHLHVHGVVAR
jgi:hypothetical protein